MKKPLSQKWFLKCSKTLRCEKIVKAIFERARTAGSHSQNANPDEICKIEFSKNDVLHIRDFSKKVMSKFEKSQPYERRVLSNGLCNNAMG